VGKYHYGRGEIKMKWNKICLSKIQCTTLASEMKISPVLAKLLIIKGITKSEEARKFLYPKIEDMHSPFLMKDMEKVVNRLLQAIKDEEKIMVYGDYDVDGITATVILVKTLRMLGAKVIYYLPNRFIEGYGLSKNGINYAATNNVSLIITVDCGIKAYDVVKYTQECGIDIIITDHHEPGPHLPEAYGIINPKQSECSYPDKELAGVGIILKIVQALTDIAKMHISFNTFFQLAAIGTIADIVPITGENRIIIKHGLKFLTTTREPGLAALLEVAGIRGKKIDTSDVGFKLAPRLNASGRIEDAMLSLELLFANTHHEAIKLAHQLNNKNILRQNIQKTVFNEAKELVHHKDNKKVIVVAKDNWHQGVIGIVASKLVDEYSYPAIVITYNGLYGKGSGRSIPQFNLLDSLTKCESCLETYGGHKYAAGFTIKRNKVDEFRIMINKYAENILNEEDIIKKIEVFDIPLEEINTKLVWEIENLLSPFGIGNPRPIFSSSNIQIIDIPRIVGNNHLKLKFCSNNNRVIEGIGFGLGDMIYDNTIYDNSDNLEIAYKLQINEWQGVSNIQLQLKDINLKSASKDGG
jgi:single-stranded-DNA-specific exonuclease